MGRYVLWHEQRQTRVEGVTCLKRQAEGRKSGLPKPNLTDMSENPKPDF